MPLPGSYSARVQSVERMDKEIELAFFDGPLHCSMFRAAVLCSEHSSKLSYMNLTEEEEEKEEQFGQIEVLYFGALSALSAGISK